MYTINLLDITSKLRTAAMIAVVAVTNIFHIDLIFRLRTSNFLLAKEYEGVVVELHAFLTSTLDQCFSPAGSRPGTGPGISYTGPREA